MADLFQVEFKGSRREVYQNTYHHSLMPNELVMVQADQGEDAGMLVRSVPDSFLGGRKPRSILRPLTPEERDQISSLREQELACKREVVALVRRHGLIMKIVDVESQFDGSKMTFYFTADHRVDFRSLVRDLASKYRTRIELRQIGVRDEARRIDGYGICGRRQCCNGHIGDFKPITTQHARVQDLSLNPSKISGNCGRLLCCLRYEVDMYAGVKQQFPPIGSVVYSTVGKGVIERIDYFREVAHIKITRPDDIVSVPATADQIKGVVHLAKDRLKMVDRQRFTAFHDLSKEEQDELEAVAMGIPEEAPPEPIVEPVPPAESQLTANLFTEVADDAESPDEPNEGEEKSPSGESRRDPNEGDRPRRRRGGRRRGNRRRGSRGGSSPSS